MKKNQVIIGVSILALVLIAIFFYMKKGKPTETVSTTDSVSTSSIDSVSVKSTTASKTAMTSSLAVVYKFLVVDNTTHKHFHAYVSFDGGTTLTEVFKIGSGGCPTADGYNYVPVSITCPDSGSVTSQQIDIYLKKADGTLIKHETKTDAIAGCSYPDILITGGACGYKIRQYPTIPLTSPIINKITVTVTEAPGEVYDDVVTWPPTIH